MWVFTGYVFTMPKFFGTKLKIRTDKQENKTNMTSVTKNSKHIDTIHMGNLFFGSQCVFEFGSLFFSNCKDTSSGHSQFCFRIPRNL